MKTIFWDFDGTIVHKNDAFFHSLKEALWMGHYAIDDSEVRAQLQAAYSWNNWETTYENETGEKWWDCLFSKLNSLYAQHDILEVDKINKTFKECMLSFHHYTIFDDAPMILEYCRNMGYHNYIVSNNYPELPKAIEKLGLSEFFSGYVISSHIGIEKPRPEIFQYAISMAGNPEICYMVGDNPVADIQGAKKLGIKTVFVHTEAILSQYADYTCENLTEIMEYIK